MSAANARDPAYVVPSYRSAPDAAWYHVLHGNVPGYQIDYLYRPDVPQGRLTQQHVSHLDRLVQCIQPRRGSACAFAIGNLSRDDTQHEAGHGAIALLFALRLRGARDHAGRRDPPFAHATVAIDRHVDRVSLFRSAMFLHSPIMDESELGPSAGLFAMYSRFMKEDEGERAAALKEYLANFEGLPALAPSRLGAKWRRGSDKAPRRVIITHADGAPFEALARCAARVAAVLYESDLRWTSVTTGGEADTLNGMSVRLVPARDVGARGGEGLVVPMDQVPDDDVSLARELFELSLRGAGPVALVRPAKKQPYVAPIRASVEETPAAPALAPAPAPAPALAPTSTPPTPTPPTPLVAPMRERPAAAPIEGTPSPGRVARRSRRWIWIGVTLLGTIVGFIAGLRGREEAVDAATLEEMRKAVRESAPRTPAPIGGGAEATVQQPVASEEKAALSTSTQELSLNGRAPRGSQGRHSSPTRQPPVAGTRATWKHNSQN